MNRSFFRRLVSASAIATAALACLPAQAGPFSSLFVFGDSLSDDGNNFLAGLYDPTQHITGNTYIPSYTYALNGTPYGTYSNGPVWASYFASVIGVPLAPSLAGGGDFAFGGATTGPLSNPFPYSLLTQTQQFLTATGGVAPSGALYVIEGGGNNARGALAAIAGGAPVNATVASTASTFASDTLTMVDELEAAGAQHIVVWDTPNLGLAPAVAAGGPVAAALGSAVATAMNAALATALAGISDVTTFDVYGLGTQVAADPALYGFTNVVDACGAVLGANCNQYAYWDGIHPTTALDRVVADELAVTLAVPEPETYGMLMLGLFAVALQSRRRRRAAAA
jgi:outer membrane lipase/esterase